MKTTQAAVPHYLEGLKALINALEADDLGPYVAQVLHDDWCDQLKGRGPCNCDPLVTIKKIAVPLQ